MRKKYEITNESIEMYGVKLFRIKALEDFADIKAGDFGGYIEGEKNLSQDGCAWVYGSAKVYGNAEVYGDARVYGDAWVYRNARVYGDAWVYGSAKVYGDAEVYGDARVYGDAWVCGNARVYGDAWVYGNAGVHGDAEVYGSAKVYENARVYGDAEVYGNAEVHGDAWVYGNAEVHENADYATASCFGSEYRTTTFFRTSDNYIGVKCGCFYGTLDEFRSKVKETHGESKTAKEYLMLADLMEYRFSD